MLPAHQHLKPERRSKDCIRCIPAVQFAAFADLPKVRDHCCCSRTSISFDRLRCSRAASKTSFRRHACQRSRSPAQSPCTCTRFRVLFPTHHQRHIGCSAFKHLRQSSALCARACHGVEHHDPRQCTSDGPKRLRQKFGPSCHRRAVACRGPHQSSSRGAFRRVLFDPTPLHVPRVFETECLLSLPRFSFRWRFEASARHVASL